MNKRKIINIFIELNQKETLNKWFFFAFSRCNVSGKSQLLYTAKRLAILMRNQIYGWVVRKFMLNRYKVGNP